MIPLVETNNEHDEGVKVVCGPGTGLGIAMILPIGSGNYQVWPTEGGHSNFAPSSDLTFEYLGFLR